MKRRPVVVKAEPRTEADRRARGYTIYQIRCAIAARDAFRAAAARLDLSQADALRVAVALLGDLDPVTAATILAYSRPNRAPRPARQVPNK